ncbi:MAG: Zn-ribbon domain-containing OB-fold protein [Acidimicrobiia bacterium]
MHEGLFTIDPPALHGSRCDACGRHSFPIAPDCPLCGAPGPEPVELSPTATLWAWTEVTAPPPGYRGEVPYGFGVVEFPEGVRVITRLTSPVADYQFGQPMHLRFVELPGKTDDAEPVTTWEFAPS